MKKATTILALAALLTACSQGQPVDEVEVAYQPDEPFNPLLQAGSSGHEFEVGDLSCLALGSSEAWPHTFPREVIIDSSWSDEHAALIVEATDRWNWAADAQLFVPVISDEVHGREGTIKIDPVESSDDLGGDQGRCSWNAHSAHVKIDRTIDTVRQVAQHELGHALNLGHEEDNVQSVMSDELKYIAKYTPFIKRHLDLLIHCATTVNVGTNP